MSMNAQSINQLVGSGTIAFNDLQSITNGKYNMGEVQAVIGQDKVKFAKVNNHVSMTRYNNVVSTPEQNLKTNAAIFKAIATEFGDGGNVDALFSRDLSTIKFAEEPVSNASSSVDESGEQSSEQSVGEQFEDLFNGFSNPYVKEAFKFLLTGGNQYRSVSRDEIHMLLQNLRARQSGEDSEGAAVKTNMEKLDVLREFKRTGAWKDETVENLGQQSDYLFGWDNAGVGKRGTLTGISDNQKEFAHLKRCQDWVSKAAERYANYANPQRYLDFLDRHPDLCLALSKEIDKVEDYYSTQGGDSMLKSANTRKSAAESLGKRLAERMKELTKGDAAAFANIASFGVCEMVTPYIGKGHDIRLEQSGFSEAFRAGLA